MAEVTLDAVLPRPPPGLPWWGKVLWFLAETVATGIVYQQFDYGTPINPTSTSGTEPTADEWRHVQVLCENLESGDAADDQTFTLDIINYTSDAVDSTWDSGDYTNVHGHLTNFCAAVAPTVHAGMRFKEARYYRRAFNPYEEPKPFAHGGTPEHVAPISIAGAGGAAVPPGNCTTITEVTPSRKNWGRLYLPTVDGTQITSVGRLAPASVDILVSAYAQMLANLHNQDFHVVVPTTSVGGHRNDALRGDYEVKPVRTLQAVVEVKVDDVVDYQHRRRHRHSTYSVRNPAPAVVEDFEGA